MSKKTSIPGSVFLMIGAFVSIASYFIDKLRNANNLRFFIIVGLLFAIYGIYKILIQKALNMGKIKKQYKHTPEYYKKSHEYKYCPKCGSKLRESFNFCYNCGKRVM